MVKEIKLPSGYKPTDKEKFMNAKQQEYFRQKLKDWRLELLDDANETRQNLQETSVAEERAEVAAVFVNRLNKGMKLQMDSTVEYGLTDGQGFLNRGLRRSELSKKTPYNTYVIKGLPPGPIGNPRRDAIRATLNPNKSDNVYFVANGTGGHAFAETLVEHNANVAKWRKIEAEKRRQQLNNSGG